jgi:sugar phosphate isomerase/epimerase
MTPRLLSLAAGVLPEFPPDVIAAAAASAGFPATGIWCDTATWTETTTRKVEVVLRANALVPLDIEVIWIRAGRTVSDSARRLIDIGGTLGARHVLIVSANPDPNDTKRQFAELCGLAEQAGMRAVLEFLMIAEVKTLAQALDIVRSVDHPAGGVLIDALHLERCGATAADVAALDRALLPYAQLCDGRARLDRTDHAAYLEDAIDGRSSPGEGELPLRRLLAALPSDLPLSLEVRSKALRNRFADPVERARAVLDATRRFLGHEGSDP